MKSLMWVIAIAAIGALAYGIVSWRRRRAEEEFPMIRFLPVREQHGLAAA